MAKNNGISKEYISVEETIEFDLESRDGKTFQVTGDVGASYTEITEAATRDYPGDFSVEDEKIVTSITQESKNGIVVADFLKANPSFSEEGVRLALEIAMEEVLLESNYDQSVEEKMKKATKESIEISIESLWIAEKLVPKMALIKDLSPLGSSLILKKGLPITKEEMMVVVEKSQKITDKKAFMERFVAATAEFEAKTKVVADNHKKFGPKPIVKKDTAPKQK